MILMPWLFPVFVSFYHINNKLFIYRKALLCPQYIWVYITQNILVGQIEMFLK